MKRQRRKGRVEKTAPRIHGRIAELRKERGLTQPELAKILGVDKTAVCHWEKGVSHPAGYRLTALANALSTTVDDLLSEAA